MAINKVRFAFAVGIHSKQIGAWIWQGITVASTPKEAKRLTKEWAVSLGYSSPNFRIDCSADGLTKSEYLEDPLTYIIPDSVVDGVYDITDFTKLKKKQPIKI
jgi:hypothetical protein